MRLDQLLDRTPLTETEEIELEHLLRDYARENGITYDPEHGYQ